MKKCDNCNAVIRDNDKYCRNCGIKITSKINKILINLYTTVLVIFIIGFIVLLVGSYFV